MLTLEEAKEFLRVDGEDNDLIITSILEGIPSFIELSTGINEEVQLKEPMVKQVTKFILSLWYHAEQSDSDKIQKVIDSLLKAIKYKYLNENIH